MIVTRKIAELKKQLQKIKFSLGFVPTMGDLHAGHLSLVRRSKKENNFTAVSIFVNPAQFNNKKDFEKYARNEERDLNLLKKEKVDLVFLPTDKELYPEGFQTWVTVENLSSGLCGEFRPGHFRGVATVVLKLFQCVQPTSAYFGLKDYQQYKILERMARDLNIPVRLVPCPTVREADGLAMSSRNSRLSVEERKRAARIPLALKECVQAIKFRKNLSESRLKNIFLKKLNVFPRDKVDYLQWVHPQTLKPLEKINPPAMLVCAVWIGETRLIDNLEI